MVLPAHASISHADRSCPTIHHDRRVLMRIRPRLAVDCDVPTSIPGKAEVQDFLTRVVAEGWSAHASNYTTSETKHSVNSQSLRVNHDEEAERLHPPIYSLNSDDVHDKCYLLDWFIALNPRDDAMRILDI